MFEPEGQEQPNTGTSDSASVSTSAAASDASVSSAETDSSQSQATERGSFPPVDNDPWADFGKSEGTKKAEQTETETPAAAVAEETKSAAAEKPVEEESSEEKREKSIEDEILDEVFEGDKVDLDKIDPEKMIASLRKPAQAWAKRNAQTAEIVHEFKNPEKPIAEVVQKLSETSPERFTEMSREIVIDTLDKHGDAVFQRLYALKMREKNPDFDFRAAKLPTLDDIVSSGFSAAGSSPSVQSPEVKNIADKLTETLGFDWRNPENDSQLEAAELPLVQVLREMEAQHAQTAEKSAKEISEADARYKALEEKLNEIQGNLKEDGDVKLQTAKMEVGQEFRDSLEGKLMPRIAKKRGLTIADDDIPEMKTVKQTLSRLYTGTEWERKNNTATMFESFAFNQSSVAQTLKGIQARIGERLDKAAEFRAKGKASEAKAAAEAAREDEISLITYLGKADDEFSEIFVKPFFSLLGKTSANLSQTNHEASERIEVTTGGAREISQTPQPKNFDTAEDVWNDMPAEAQRKAALRGAA